MVKQNKTSEAQNKERKSKDHSKHVLRVLTGFVSVLERLQSNSFIVDKNRSSSQKLKNNLELQKTKVLSLILKAQSKNIEYIHCTIAIKS